MRNNYFQVNMNKIAITAKLMGEVNVKIRNHMRKEACHEEFTFAQAVVLNHLSMAKEMRISDLSRMLGLSNSTVSGIIDRLEKNNSVKRTRSIQDRRVVYVRVTNEFLKIHDSFEASFEKAFAKLLSTAREDDLDRINTGFMSLNKVLNNIEEKGENKNDQDI